MVLYASDVIDALGGNTPVAKVCGCSVPAVSMWRKTGIPSERVLAMVALAKKRGVAGITADALLASRPGKKPEKPSKSPDQRGRTSAELNGENGESSTRGV